MHRDKMVFKRLAKSFKLNILFDYDFMQLQVGVIMPEPFNPSAAGTLPKQLRLLTWPWSWEYTHNNFTPHHTVVTGTCTHRGGRDNCKVWSKSMHRIFTKSKWLSSGRVKPLQPVQPQKWGSVWVLRSPGQDFFFMYSLECPQKEHTPRYAEAQPYKPGDADVGMYTQFTYLPAQLHLS